MFNIEDRDKIIALVDMRNDGECLIPLYVRIDNDIFSILELDSITRFNPYSFKVGFGAVSGLFIKNGFDDTRVLNFHVVNVFNHYDENSMTERRYTIFESGYIHDVNVSNIDSLINTYVNMLSDHVEQHVLEIRKEMIRKQLEEYS